MVLVTPGRVEHPTSTLTTHQSERAILQDQTSVTQLERERNGERKLCRRQRALRKIDLKFGVSS